MAISIQTTAYYLIYIFRRPEITDAIKIGKATVEAYDIDELTPNCDKLNEAAHKRILDETLTAATQYELLHTEVACFVGQDGKYHRFIDDDVHAVLEHSGYDKKTFEGLMGNPKDWYKVNLETAIKAITAIKNGQDTIDGPVVEKEEKVTINFREEQERAIKDTISHYDDGRKMLWNAKMRFGKTLCALELIRRKGFRRTLILTHRPTVRSGWFDDYHLINFENFQYGSKDGDKYARLDKKDTKGKDFQTLEASLKDPNAHYIYFASMQDLRGSSNVAEKGIDKNLDVFKTNWDLIILDEAHEGTQTDLGKNVIKELSSSRDPYFLYLSGTPFNILSQFVAEEIYTWDYVMEQEAKEKWPENHPGEANPYEGLAKLNIFTYNLGEVFEQNPSFTHNDDDYFNFAEFFRTWSGDEKKDGKAMGEGDKLHDFIHKDYVRNFLDLLVKESPKSYYPYSNESFRDGLAHTLWMVPGVDQASALEKMILAHTLHTELGFEVINVAGNGSKVAETDPDDTKKIEKYEKDALKRVKTAVAAHKRTITLSCGRLTTGVSVPEWTGVFMLCGGYSTGAANYMQTIFRGQTPYKNGAIKTNCYAFDFAPDRTLTVIDDYIKSQPKSGNKPQNPSDKTKDTQSFLKFCPVIAMEGGKEIEYSALKFIQKVNDAYSDHVISNGFKGRALFKNYAEFTEEDFALLSQIGKLLDKGNVKVKSDGTIDMSRSGLTGEGEDKGKKGKGKKGGSGKTTSGSTPSPRNPYDEERKKRERSQEVLDQIFVRLPLLLFGSVTDTSGLTIDAILDNSIIDNESWEEFMPNKFTKAMLKQIAHLVKVDVLISSATKIIEKAKAADNLPIEDRVIAMAQMLHKFHYPDKETVLTPWKVVNMHLGTTIGGYSFFNDGFSHVVDAPHWIECAPYTESIFRNDSSKVLEINSKSGVYPLYLAYSFYRVQLGEDVASCTYDQKEAVWQSVLKNNVYVLCKTKMAQKITRRVLAGYKEYETNCQVYPNLVPTLKLKDDAPQKKRLVKEILSSKFWNNPNNGKTMEFKAIVGNPPYQITKEKTSDEPIYNLFIDLSEKLASIATFITPARFLFDAGKTPKAWNKKMLNNPHFKVVWYKGKSAEVFPKTDIKGGVAVTLIDKSRDFGAIKTFTVHEELNELTQLVSGVEGFVSLDTIIHHQNKFNLTELYNDHPQYKAIIGSEGEEKRFTTSIFSQATVFSDSSTGGNDLTVLGLIDNVRVEKHIDQRYVEASDKIGRYKVIVAYSNGNGALGEALSTPVVLGPNYGFTQSFIGIGSFETESEAQAALKYVKTKFARIMLGVLKVTQHNGKDTWRHVPLLDFTSNSFIDWSLTVEEIDEMLFEHYALPDSLREFIRNTAQVCE